jgi:hypothetical protein
VESVLSPAPTRPTRWWRGGEGRHLTTCQTPTTYGTSTVRLDQRGGVDVAAACDGHGCACAPLPQVGCDVELCLAGVRGSSGAGVPVVVVACDASHIVAAPATRARETHGPLCVESPSQIQKIAHATFSATFVTFLQLPRIEFRMAAKAGLPKRVQVETERLMKVKFLMHFCSSFFSIWLTGASSGNRGLR